MWYGGDGSFTREREKMKEASLIFFSEFSPDHLSTGTGKNEKSIFDIFFFFQNFLPITNRGKDFYGRGCGRMGIWVWYGGDGSFPRERAKMKKESLIFFSKVFPDYLFMGTGKNEKSIFDIFSRIFSRSYIF